MPTPTTPSPAPSNRVPVVHVRFPIIFYIAALAVIFAVAFYFARSMSQPH